MDKDKDMSRRRFLKMAALTGAAMCVGPTLNKVTAAERVWMGNNKLQTTSLQAWRRCALGEHWDTEIRHSLFLQWDMAVWA